MQEVETAFESSEFRQLILEASDDSLNQALELFNVPGAVNVTLRGKPSATTMEEVRSMGITNVTIMLEKNVKMRFTKIDTKTFISLLQLSYFTS